MRNISGKHIAVLVDNYFEQAEYEEPIRTLADAGADVTVIATKDKHLQGLNHADKGDEFEADLLLEQADWIDYDALVLPGGAINADSLRVNEEVKQWTSEFLDSGKPVAVICHSPWILVSADLVDGRKLTSYHTIRDDIMNAGGDWVDMPVVIDDNLITSRQPDDIPLFTETIMTMLEDQPESAVEQGADTIIAPTETANEADSRIHSLGYDTKRDDLSRQDKSDLLSDQELDDPDELQPSSLGPSEEKTDTY
ncbi:MAG TPA: type 1 glutamine amidotransferase domain-containing protein [Candidatus Saccharimonadales bacterium]|nr:type 1 glutamine amidotransferase domain-containing protein [Candidatus Saccharimonadales bacterium]